MWIFFSNCWMERGKKVTSTYSFCVWRRWSNIKFYWKVSWVKAILWERREPLPVIQRLDKIKKEGKSAEAGEAHPMQPGVLLIIMSSIADNPPWDFLFSQWCNNVSYFAYTSCTTILPHLICNNLLLSLHKTPPLLFKGKYAVLFVMTSQYTGITWSLNDFKFRIVFDSIPAKFLMHILIMYQSKFY